MTYRVFTLIENIFLLQFSTNLKYIRFFDRKLDFWRLYLQNVFDVFIYKRKYCVNALSNLVTSSYKDDELCLATLPTASPDTFWIHHMKAKKKKNHDDNAWGNKRHLPIIMITFLLANFDFYPSFPIFYSPLKIAWIMKKLKNKHLAQKNHRNFLKNFLLLCMLKRFWPCLKFSWWSVFLGEWCIVSVE